MKSKKNIKSIVAVAIIGIISLFFINMSLAANTAKVSVETANLRENADSNSKILELLSLNQEVEILEKSGEWYKVKANGITGYLKENLLNVKSEEKKQEVSTTNAEEQKEPENKEEQVESKDGQEENKDNQTNKKFVKEDTKLKIVPIINATDIIEVKKEEEVTVIEVMNGWSCIETQNTKGWIRTEKLQDKKAEEPKQEETKPEETKPEEVKQEIKWKTKYVSSESVNVRKEANTSAEIIAKVTLNTKLEVSTEENGWSKVKVDGKEGYISSALLSDKKKETSRGMAMPRTSNTTNATSQKQTDKKEETTNTKTPPPSGKGSTVVETARKYIGCKYVYGGTTPSGFDCSGFTKYVMGLHGVTLSRTAATQYNNGVAVSKAQLQPGDLVMFGPSVKGINHVGIYIGGGQMVHASTPSTGVRIDSINSSYYAKNYVGARRVI